jgi:hypothetical protein
VLYIAPMGSAPPNETEKTEEQVSFLAGMGLVMAVSLIFFSANPGLQKRLIEDSPIPAAAGIAIFVALMTLIAFVTAKRSKGLAIVVGLAMVPGIIANAATRLSEPDPAWVDDVRAIGLLALLVVTFGGVLLFARRYREFEKYVFTEATSLAFFVTVIAAGAYAVFQATFDLPRLSFGWIPLIGLASWGASVALVSRRLK